MSKQDQDSIREELANGLRHRPEDMDVRLLDADWYEQARAKALQRKRSELELDSENT